MNTEMKYDIYVPMTDRDKVIQTAQTAVIERMKGNLDAARSTIKMTGRIEEGLTCQVEQGPHSAVLDLGRGMGGDAAGPSPGFFARAGIVGCVGIAVKMLAAREGVTYRSVTITLENDFDDAALMCLSTRSAAPLETRLKIEIDTDASPAVVEALVERALAHDPWYLALRDAQIVRHQTCITQDAAASN